MFGTASVKLNKKSIRCERHEPILPRDRQPWRGGGTCLALLVDIPDVVTHGLGEELQLLLLQAVTTVEGPGHKDAAGVRGAAL